VALLLVVAQPGVEHRRDERRGPLEQLDVGGGVVGGPVREVELPDQRAAVEDRGRTSAGSAGGRAAPGGGRS
jgi:hypothetical protein